MNPMFKIRLKYLLMRDFNGTVKQWREAPEGLRVEIVEHLKRADENRERLRRNDLMSFEIDELVYSLVSPADMPCRVVLGIDLFDQIMDRATEVS